MIWPKANVLSGVTMQILARQLKARGIPQQTREIHQSETDRLSAVVMNSWTPAIPIAHIGAHQLENDPAFARVLHDAYVTEPPVQV